MMRLDINCVSLAMTETFFIAAEFSMAVVGRISFQFFKEKFSSSLLYCLKGRLIGRFYVT
jgi:hypothetical protein